MMEEFDCEYPVMILRRTLVAGRLTIWLATSTSWEWPPSIGVHLNPSNQCGGLGYAIYSPISEGPYKVRSDGQTINWSVQTRSQHHLRLRTLARIRRNRCSCTGRNRGNRHFMPWWDPSFSRWSNSIFARHSLASRLQQHFKYPSPFLMMEKLLVQRKQGLAPKRMFFAVRPFGFRQESVFASSSNGDLLRMATGQCYSTIDKAERTLRKSPLSSRTFARYFQSLEHQ